MAANTKPVFIRSALTTAANTSVGVSIAVGDTTDKKVVTVGGIEGTIIQDLVAVNSTADAKALDVWWYDGTTEWPLGQVAIPASAGTSTTPSVSLLNTTAIPSLAKRDDGAFILGAGQSFKVSAAANVEAAQVIYITAIGGNL
jgi:hypothetical protein